MTSEPAANGPPAIPAADEHRRSVAHWVWVTVFFASGLGTLRLAIDTADVLVLRWVYGPERVARERLEVVGHKPVLRVSNGDELEPWGFRAFVLASAIWLPSAVATLFAVRCLLPREYRDVAAATSVKGLPNGLFTALLLPTLLLVICVSGSAVACGVVVVVAVVVAWVSAKRGVRPAGSGLNVP